MDFDFALKMGLSCDSSTIKVFPAIQKIPQHFSLT